MPYIPIGPGPGAFKLKPLTGYNDHDFSKTRWPRYTMQSKAVPPTPCAIGPGPAYRIDKYTRFGKEIPIEYSMQRKYRPEKRDIFPGPQYSPKYAHPRAPAYSMQRKYKPDTPCPTPGPLDYVPTLPRRYPAYSMQMKYKPKCPDLTPGPYGAISPNITKDKKPIYTMISKAHPKQPQPCSPGPKYFPNLPKKCMDGQPPFGHRDYRVDVYYTDEDRVPACEEFRRIC